MASDPLDIGIIGLGVMGQRMLARVDAHPRLRAVQVWDADPQAVARTLAAYPDVRIAGGPDALIATPGLRSLYIATPPGPHMDLSNRAFDAGLAVFCEKPLTTDFDAARRTIARIEREGLRAAVNFSLASSPGLAAMQAAWQARGGGLLGTPASVEIALGFVRWPRAWQSAAGAWLGERAEGGFSREVLSHFVFVLQRALGRATVRASRPDWPADGRSSETGLTATLEAGGLPVTIRARVGEGEPEDFNRMTLQGSAGALALHDWFGAQQRVGEGAWTPVGDAAANRAHGQAEQLEQWVALIEGRSHTLPSYAEALAVQETIEALLTGA